MPMESLMMIVLLFVLMYFMMIRPEKKRKQKAQEMRDNLKKGDVITTIGGIVGKVVSVNESTFVIETSDDRVRMEFTKWALSANGVQTGETPAEEKKKKAKKAVSDEVPEEPKDEEAPAAETTEEK